MSTNTNHPRPCRVCELNDKYPDAGIQGVHTCVVATHPRPFCYRCTIRVAHTDCDVVLHLEQQQAPTTPALAPMQAWQAATTELADAGHAYHQAIDATERAAASCNFAWYDAARSTEREAAERYTLAVRGEHVTRQVLADATRAVLNGAGHATA
jgi:hypothetical protein